jgi:hypothetical protein
MRRGKFAVGDGIGVVDFDRGFSSPIIRAEVFRKPHHDGISHENMGSGIAVIDLGAAVGSAIGKVGGLENTVGYRMGVIGVGSKADLPMTGAECLQRMLCGAMVVDNTVDCVGIMSLGNESQSPITGNEGLQKAVDDEKAGDAAGILLGNVA